MAGPEAEEARILAITRFMTTIQDPVELRDRLSEFHAADIHTALDDLLDQLSPRTVRDILGALTPAQRAEVLDEIPEPEADSFLESAPMEAIVETVQAMPPDEAVDILEHMDEDRRAEVVSRLDPEHAGDIRALSQYPADVAGGIMTNDFFALDPSETASEPL